MSIHTNEVDPGLDPNKATFVRPRVTSIHREGTQVRVSSRDHTWVIDEPVHKGGTDLGPTPLESLLGSLVGCETVVLQIVAKAIGFAYASVDIDCEGTADMRGARGVKGVRPYFSSVRMEITLATDEPENRVDLLRRNVELRCPVMNLFAAADVDLEINWAIVPTGAKA